MDNTYKTTVQLTGTQLQELSTVFAKSQLGRSDLVRRAVDHYLIEIRKQGTLPSLNSLQTRTNDAAAEEQWACTSKPPRTLISRNHAG